MGEEVVAVEATVAEEEAVGVTVEEEAVEVTVADMEDMEEEDTEEDTEGDTEEAGDP